MEKKDQSNLFLLSTRVQMLKTIIARPIHSYSYVVFFHGNRTNVTPFFYATGPKTVEKDVGS